MQLLKVRPCHTIKNVLSAYQLRYGAERVGLMHSFALRAFLLPIVQSIYFVLQRSGRLDDLHVCIQLCKYVYCVHIVICKAWD